MMCRYASEVAFGPIQNDVKLHRVNSYQLTRGPPVYVMAFHENLGFYMKILGELPWNDSTERQISRLRNSH